MDRVVQAYAFSGTKPDHKKHCEDTIYDSSFLEDLFIVSAVLANRLVLNKNYHTDSFKSYLDEETMNKWIYFILVVLQGQLDTFSHFSLMHLICQMQYQSFWFEDINYLEHKKKKEPHVLQFARNNENATQYKICQEISQCCFLILKLLYYFPSYLYQTHPIDVCLSILCYADQIIHEKHSQTNQVFTISSSLDHALRKIWKYHDSFDTTKYMKKIVDNIMILKTCITESCIYNLIPSIQQQLVVTFESLQLSKLQTKKLMIEDPNAKKQVANQKDSSPSSSQSSISFSEDNEFSSSDSK